MNFDLNRPYKTDTPLNTITKIRNILAKLDCMVYEISWGNPYNEIYSVRIENDEKDGKFGSNGKGRNRIFTLASAYAEFIERLQNGLLAGSSYTRMFLEKIKKETGYFYFPDERFLSKKEFDKLPTDFLNDVVSGMEKYDLSIKKYFDRLSENGYPGCIAVPFFDIKRKKTVYLPFNLAMMLTSSNGMAAGNTLEEAIFQALCEVLERFGACEVFLKQLTPPTVPRDYLKKFKNEYEIIKSIERATNFEVIVKDFSANKRLPVLGVIIMDKKKKRYRLNVGADTSYAVCLSRCLTEIHQGIKTQEAFEDVMLQIPETTQDYFLKNDEESQRIRIEQFVKFTYDGRAVFPRSLFEEQESYPLDHSIFQTCDTYEKEVKRLIKLITSLNYNIYIRDVSLLGFPSVYVYVPVLSPMGKKAARYSIDNIDFDNITGADMIEDLFFPFEDCTDSKMYKLAKMIDRPGRPLVNRSSDGMEIIEPKMQDLLKLEFNRSSDWYTLPSSFFLTLFWYKLNRFDDASRNLKLFMKNTKNEEDSYYRTILNFLQYKAQNKNIDEIRASLGSDGFDKETINEVLETFSDNSKLFDKIDIPICPECKKCPLQSECQTKNKINLTKRLNLEMKNNPVFQENLMKFSQ